MNQYVGIENTLVDVV